ncbi:M56 family metallopeptidase [Parashewanella tropica]|uniref:M56 family metallopeptidase n=1 Tax=Parashewanella tropica TaxID=2547970 RepID=UPI001059BE74|nr:M56 family metallopeptidase [Parashewanella tropica]
MFENDTAVWLNLTTIAIISFILANFAVSTLFSFTQHKLFNISPISRRFILWLMAIAPWVTAICVFCDFTFAMLRDMENIGTFVTHWHHISTFTFTSWHGVLLLGWVTATVFIISTKLLKLFRHQQQVASLERFSSKNEQDIYLLDSDSMTAFTSGMVSPKCYVSNGMLDKTSQTEQQVIFQHELAHAQNYDPFKKWLFSLLASFYLQPIAIKMKLHMSLTMEQMADDAIPFHHASKTDVASTLIKVARLNQNTDPKLEQECITNFGANALEQRVLFLLGQLENKRISKTFSFTLLAITTACCLLSLDSIHHLVEVLFNH